MDSLGNIWKHIYSGPRNSSALWLVIIVRYTNTLILLTYLLSYKLGVLVKWPNIESRKQHRTTAQGV